MRRVRHLCGGARFLAATLTLTLIAGCPKGGGGDESKLTQIQELEDKVREQARVIEEQREQLAEQERQIQRLQGMTEAKRMEWVTRVDRVELATLSGGYDDDNDGIDEGIVLYVRPVDADGDVIKAAGSASVRLLDLALPADRQEVGSVSLDPQQLRKAWFGRLSSHYTIKIPWASGVERAQNKTITVLLTFNEYLTGRSFSVQQAFDVGGVAATQPSQP